jgi:ABC-2 type transport system ATP-binding protein
MDDAAVIVENVSKTFKLPHDKSRSVKGNLINIVKGRRGYELQHALQDVSFEIKKGEFFGIVGKNGSGKSTLLKILSGIYTPSKGVVHIRGKLTPFIELGVGFNPELSGRENVYLNGALLGFNRKEVEAMYDTIVEFAELERFMDQKLKNYSSGMQVRLAFSIAIQAQSDLLVLDEVLAVGDESFQRKCIDVFERLKANKQTVILVTHDMANVTQFCDRALLLSEGKLVDIGSPAKIANIYTQLNQADTDKQTARQNSTQSTELAVKAKITDIHDVPIASFRHGERLKAHFEWSEDVPVQNIGLAIMKESGELIFGANTLKSKVGAASAESRRCTFETELNLGPGRYYFMYGAFGKTRKDSLYFVERGPSFIVVSDVGAAWEGITKLKSEWHGGA